MSPEDLRRRARRIAEELLTQGDLPIADELFAPDCRHHAPRPIRPGASGAKAWVGALRTAFPDLYAIVDDEVVEGTRAAQRLCLSGTHTGEWFGVPPRGRRASWQVIEMLRAGPDGRFTEHWCFWDERGLLRQLGAVSTGEEIG